MMKLVASCHYMFSHKPHSQIMRSGDVMKSSVSVGPACVGDVVLWALLCVYLTRVEMTTADTNRV